MNLSQRKRKKNKGFTLLEVLLVMAILIILMSLVGAGYFTYFANSQEDAARVQMQSIEQACKGYYMDTNQPPSKIDDLVIQPSGMSNRKWRGPYLDGGKVPVDPWGSPYRLTIGNNGQGQSARNMVFIISSLGPDKRENSDDDISTQEDQQANQ